jgi:hypothetical protein
MLLLIYSFSTVLIASGSPWVAWGASSCRKLAEPGGGLFRSNNGSSQDLAHDLSWNLRLAVAFPFCDQ